MKEKKEDTQSAELVCVKQCDIPGVREFQPGDRIQDPELIAKYKDNPYFKTASTEDKQS
jgi:hypothetical protein